MLPSHSHTIIIGSGLAGLELARELTGKVSAPVLVIDSGPATDLRHVNVAYPPETALRLWLQPSTDPCFRQPWSSSSPPSYTVGSGIRERLGGRSLYWYGVILRAEPWALAEPWWPAEVITELTGSSPLYRRVEEMLRQWQGDGNAASTPADVRVGSLRLFRTPLAVRHSPAGNGRWYAYSPLDHWRLPLTGETDRLPRDVLLRPRTRALRLCTQAGSIRGVLVEHDDVVQEIRADVVVLAAGTIENSRLAIQVLHENKMISRPRLPGLYDHLVQGVFIRLAAAQADGLFEVVPPGSYYRRCDPASRSNLFLHLQRLGDGEALVDLQATGEQLPSAENYVACEPTADPAWPVRIHAAPGPDDVPVLAAQQRILEAAWCEIARVTGCPAVPLEFSAFNAKGRTNEFVLPEHILSVAPGKPVTWAGLLGTEDHEGGTLPLGKILAPSAEFPEIGGLFATGPCIFPRMGAANPSLTTLALAHRLAKTLSQRG